MQTVGANPSAAMASDTAVQKKQQAQTSATTDTSNDQSTSATDKATPTESVELSSRAQKIQKLGEEFFPSGPKSIQITEAFITRLQEYGLISEGEANRLTTTTQDKSKPSQLTELTQFTERLSEQLKKSNPEHSLINTLEQAKSVIDQLDVAQPSAINIKSVIAELSLYRHSVEAQSLSDADRSSLSQLEASLTIADKLSPENTSSQKINHYLKIFNQD